MRITFKLYEPTFVIRGLIPQTDYAFSQAASRKTQRILGLPKSLPPSVLFSHEATGYAP